MPYSPLLPIHIAGGIAGMLSGTAALIFRKGGRWHVLAGKVFVASMLIMSAFAVYLAVLKHQSGNIGGGILTFYLILTAWLTARRRDRQTSAYDWALLLIPLALGSLTWLSGMQKLRSPVPPEDGVPAGMNFFMGTVMLLAGAGDLRMLLGGGVAGAKRVVRHLWRMCFGLFIAAGSFFLGPSNRPLRLLSALGIGQHLSPALFGATLYIFLSVLPLILLIFWVFRVWFSGAYRKKVVAAQSPAS
jgi:hypothetical protein